MLNLKNRMAFILPCILSLGCQSRYKIETYHIEDQEFHVIQIPVNRVKQQCLFLNAEDEGKWRHQYLMLVLNANNDTMEITDPLNMDIESCKKQILEIEKIMKVESIVNLCVRGPLKMNTTHDGSWLDTVDFGFLGVHHVRYESLTFDTICNSKKCYGDNSAYTYTCPGFTKK